LGPPRSTLFPYTTLFRSLLVVVDRGAVLRRLAARGVGVHAAATAASDRTDHDRGARVPARPGLARPRQRARRLFPDARATRHPEDRKSTRLNSSHVAISF